MLDPLQSGASPVTPCSCRGRPGARPVTTATAPASSRGSHGGALLQGRPSAGSRRRPPPAGPPTLPAARRSRRPRVAAGCRRSTRPDRPGRSSCAPPHLRTASGTAEPPSGPSPPDRESGGDEARPGRRLLLRARHPGCTMAHSLRERGGALRGGSERERKRVRGQVIRQRRGPALPPSAGGYRLRRPPLQSVAGRGTRSELCQCSAASPHPHRPVSPGRARAPARASGRGGRRRGPGSGCRRAESRFGAWPHRGTA